MATYSSSFLHRRPCHVEQGQPPAAQVTRSEGKSEEEEEKEEKKEEEKEEERRDWAELPRDVLVAVLRRLDQADVLMGPEHVCRPWRRAAREEPELWRDWRRVDLRGRFAAGILKALAYAAARRCGGRCEAFWVQGVHDDSFVFFLSSTAPTLKSLRLIYCYISTTHDLIAGIRQLPMLEELELSLYSGTATNMVCNLAEACAVAAEACPLLKSLRLSRYRFHWLCRVGDGEAMGIAGMRGLRSLQLFGNSLGNVGLAAILDGCPDLESLDIRHCFNVEMDDEMRARCARVWTLRLPHDSMDDYDLMFGSPAMEPASRPWSPGDPDNIGSDWYFR